MRTLPCFGSGRVDSPWLWSWPDPGVGCAGYESVDSDVDKVAPGSPGLYLKTRHASAGQPVGFGHDSRPVVGLLRWLLEGPLPAVRLLASPWARLVVGS